MNILIFLLTDLEEQEERGVRKEEWGKRRGERGVRKEEWGKGRGERGVRKEE